MMSPQWVPARTPTVHWGRYDGRPWVARQHYTFTKVQKSNKLYKGLQHGSGASHDKRQPLPQVTRRATTQEPITDHAGTCTTCVASREEHRI